jgi:hypothetical protein
MIDNNYTTDDDHGNRYDVFLQPSNDCTLWRYLDFTKFVSLLQTRKLAFSRSDLFEDPFEGTWPKATIKLVRQHNEQNGIPAHSLQELIDAMPRFQRMNYISCWTAQEHESAAMWKLYLKSNEGVAIRTCHSRLSAILERSPLSVCTTLVRYIDYDTTPIPIRSVMWPFVCKRASFSHESEWRAIVWAGRDKNRPHIEQDATIVFVDADPLELITSVHVAPTAPKWFGELVVGVCGQFGLDAPIVRSGLYDRPAY